ncbi:MAG: ABC transporter substrate-binding protein [bacterium]|nr:ABC transporter substrate-binding protein [bacterium]
MKKKFVTLSITLIMVFGLQLSAFGMSVKMKDDRGIEIQITAIPKGIISLVPSHTEILRALGLDNRIIAASDYCALSEKAKDTPRVGGFLNPSIQRITELKPDLVLSFGTVQLPTVKALEEKGVTVFWLYPGNVAEVLKGIERIGKLTGAIQEAGKLRQKIALEIKDTTEKLSNVTGDSRPGIVRVMGTTPPASIGGRSFQTDVIRLAGGKNSFAGVDKDYFQIAPDTLKNAAPDVVIICGRDEAHLKQKLKGSAGWQELDAVKKDRVLVIPCDIICRPGPNIGRSIATIARFLHPRCFAPANSPIGKVIRK